MEYNAFEDQSNWQQPDSGDPIKSTHAILRIETNPPIESPKTPHCSILTITVKDDEKTLRSKYLIYESYFVHPDDAIIKECIAKALKDFNGEPSDIRIRINLEL
jgi:hypothetical protein